MPSSEVFDARLKDYQEVNNGYVGIYSYYDEGKEYYVNSKVVYLEKKDVPTTYEYSKYTQKSKTSIIFSLVFVILIYILVILKICKSIKKKRNKKNIN